MFNLVRTTLLALLVGASTIPGWAAGVVSTPTEAALNTALAGGGNVTFTCDGVIPVTSTKTIAVDTTIDATGHSIVIDGGNAVRLFVVNSGASLRLLSLTVRNGRSPEEAPQGGAILCKGRLSVTHCTFSNNKSTGAPGYSQDSNVPWGAAPGGASEGGAIYNEAGIVSVFNSTFNGNVATGGAGGTGMRSSITYPPAAGDGGNGSGGAIASNDGSLSLTNCTLTANRAVGGSGGNLWTESSGSEVSGRGGNGSGGAIASSGSVSVTNCTISGNEASGGSDGDYYDINGNRSPSTSTGSSLGSNVTVDAPATANIVNSIVANGSGAANCAATTAATTAATINDGGNNMSSDGSCGFGASSYNNTDPLLQPLANNGGLTFTMALASTSPAINHGNATVAPATDQRAASRLGVSDIGAYEYGGSLPFAPGGRITNSSGIGIGGVSIALSPAPTGLTNPVLTDSDGNFSFGLVPGGSYAISPTKTTLSFSPAMRTVSSTNSTASFTALFSINGLVRTSSLVPIPGVALTLRTTAGTLPPGVANPVYSDSTGAYRFTDVPSGLYTLAPVKSGVSFSPASQGLGVTTVSRGANFIGTLVYRIIGRISSSASSSSGTSTSSALGGVSVSRGAGSTPVLTNSAGYYTFSGVPNGSYTITPQLNGYAFTPISRTVVVNNADALGQNFIGAQGFLVSGHIATGSGTSLANVAVSRSGQSTPVLTNSSGDYSLIVPNGSYTLTPTLSGYTFTPASRNITVNGAALTAQSFSGTAVPAYRIIGRLATSSGTAIANVRVTRSGSTASVLTNSAGYYTLTGVPNGSYIVTPSFNGKTFTPVSKTVTINGADALGQNFIGMP